jgi:hypothetical protein
MAIRSITSKSPENELEEIMKVEADIFGLKTERDSDSYYMKGIAKIEMKKRAFEPEDCLRKRRDSFDWGRMRK